MKKIVYGVEVNAQSIAVESEWLLQNGHWEHKINDQILRLEANSSGGITGTLDGQPIPIHRMYWFAWYSFHPDTALIH